MALSEEERLRRKREAQARYKAKYPGRQQENYDRWRKANPERAKELANNWRARNPEKIQARNKAKWADPEKRAKSQAEYRDWVERNREKMRAKSLQWQKDNPEKAQARNLRRKARLKSAPVVDFSAADWADLLDEYDHRCAYCGVDADVLEREHIIPLSRGGAHTKSNIVPACRSCNASKATRTAAEWLAA